MPLWYVIDGDERRPFDTNRMDFWSQFEYSGDDGDWPGFTQLVVDATAVNVEKAVCTVAETVELEAADVDPTDGVGHGALCLARNGDALSLAEPRVDLDERFLHEGTADAIAGLLACNGAFFGHDPSNGMLHITTFDLGAPELAWYDSVEPGPSFARTFHRDGTATDQDPRKYALHVLDMPETSPLLDRYAFVHVLLQQYGIERIAPDLDDLDMLKSWLLRAG